MFQAVADGPASIEYIMNGAAQGGFAQRLLATNGDINSLKPYIGADGRTYVSVFNQNSNQLEAVLTNAPATLRFQDWRLIDEAIIRVAKPRLRFVGDLRSQGLEVSLANGFGFTQFSYEDMSDISPATLSMDAITVTQGDRPVFRINNLPLVIAHKDFSFATRQVMASRNGYTPIDTASAELAARRVAETIEMLHAGVLAQYTWGGGTAWGLTNFTNRLTKTITAPTAAGWTPATMIAEVLAMRLQSQLAYHFGPWMIYTSPNLDQYLDEDYSSAKGDWTLRQRICQIDGIMDCRTLDYLQFLTNTPYTLLMVQFTNDVTRTVIGQDITSLQYESHGGMQMNYKIMAIMVPQFRADQNGNTGIVHGSASYP